MLQDLAGKESAFKETMAGQAETNKKFAQTGDTTISMVSYAVKDELKKQGLTKVKIAQITSKAQI